MAFDGTWSKTFKLLIQLIRAHLRDAWRGVWIARAWKMSSDNWQSCSQSLRSPWPAVWEQPFQACAIDADCAVKPDGQNSVISFVISKRFLPESLVFRPLVKGHEDSGNEIGQLEERPFCYRHKLLTWTVGLACHRCLAERLLISWTILTWRLTLLVLISVRRATDTKATRNELKSSDTTYKKRGKKQS